MEVKSAYVHQNGHQNVINAMNRITDVNIVITDIYWTWCIFFALILAIEIVWLAINKIYISV